MVIVDEAELEACIHEHWPAVEAYLRRRLPAHEVDDLVNRVFATAWRRRSDIPDPPGTRPWLFAVARNHLQTHRRSTARRFRLQRKAEAEAVPAAHPGHGDPRTEAVFDALATLSAQDQELLRLVAWEELDNTEIAAVLGTSPGNVGVRLHRARGRLRKAMEKNAAVMKSEPGNRRETLREGRPAREDRS